MLSRAERMLAARPLTIFDIIVDDEKEVATVRLLGLLR